MGNFQKLIRNPFNPRTGGNPEQSALLLGIEVGNRWPHSTILPKSTICRLSQYYNPIVPYYHSLHSADCHSTTVYITVSTSPHQPPTESISLLLQRLVPEVPNNENPVRKKEILFFSVGGDPSKYLNEKF